MSWHEYNIYSKTYTEGSDPFMLMLFALSLGLPFTATTSALSFGDYRPEEFSGVVMFVSLGGALRGGASASVLRMGDAVSGGIGWSIGFDGSLGGDVGGNIGFQMREIGCKDL